MANMRSINIDDETYRFLQSKAIPYEEQPVDTIKRLLSIGSNGAGNQTSTTNSNHSNAATLDQDGKQGGAGVAMDKRQELRDFYSKVLEKNQSNNQGEGVASSLNQVYSNKSLEFRSNKSALLENNSNSGTLSNSNNNSNSNPKTDSNMPYLSNSKVELDDDKHSKPESSSGVPKNTPLPMPAGLTGIGGSNFSNSASPSAGLKNKKKPKTSMPELIRAGILKENERVIFQNYRGVKFPQYEVTISDGLLKWKGNRYSMSDLASKLLKDQDPSQDNDFVRGPVLWVNAAGKTIAELWEKYLAQKGA